MSEQLFHIDMQVPFACSALSEAEDTTPILRGSRLLLRAIILSESPTAHGERGDAGSERLEAKLDLMLHWLGISLFGSIPPPPTVPLHLDAEGVEWQAESGLAPGQRVLVTLQVHPGLAAPLRLPARISWTEANRLRAEFRDLDEELAELWTQWIFRRHRRAVHGAREGG